MSELDLMLLAGGRVSFIRLSAVPRRVFHHIVDLLRVYEIQCLSLRVEILFFLKMYSVRSCLAMYSWRETLDHRDVHKALIQMLLINMSGDPLVERHCRRRLHAFASTDLHIAASTRARAL